MTKYKLEYIWLDGKKPVPDLRGKTLLKAFEKPPTLADLPNWGFDGSSTMQAEGKSSDCVLKPVALYPDASRKDGYIVLSEVMHPDGTPHSTNTRATIENDPDLWVGFEQEYFLYQGRPSARLPRRTATRALRRARTTAASATSTWAAWPAQIVEEHLELCLAAGINHEGINAEVAKGQWEFQIFAKGSAKAADDVWTARYLMMRLCEKYEVDVELHCKPIKGDWNGSGMHINFSTKYIREVGGKEYFEALMKAFSRQRRRAHRGLRPGQPSAPDRPARNAGDRQVQLRPLRSRRFHPHARELHQERLQGLPGRSPSELRRRSLPDRLADSEDDQQRSEAGFGRYVLVSAVLRRACRKVRPPISNFEYHPRVLRGFFA